MRALKILPALLFFALLLTACGPKYAAEGNLVYVENSENYTVVNNGVHVLPGDDVTFEIIMKSGVGLTGCDYLGDYEITTRDSQTLLCIKNVQFSTRITLQVSTRTVKITYDPNGGTNKNGVTETVAKTCSLQYHARPNTEPGTTMFFRDGYTLTAWNTRPDGTGESVGLGSRITLLSGELTLYAQWEKWSDTGNFKYEIANGTAAITGYCGNEKRIVIPAYLGGAPVTVISEGAFRDIDAASVVLCPGLREIEEGAFINCSFSELVFYDDIETFSDASFKACADLMTLRVNAVEAPFGYIFRRESAYADKVDMLILNKGHKKMIFYGGCSMWYNLDGSQADKMFGDRYSIINMGLNGTVSSVVQLQIISKYVEAGDILFHAPEFSSSRQLMTDESMGDNDSNLWCGLENNYDLFALVDIRNMDGVFDSFYHYLMQKTGRTDYQKYYTDDNYTSYMDSYGGIPFYRSKRSEQLSDIVTLKVIKDGINNLDTLAAYYNWFESVGVKVYVSYACLNKEALDNEELSKVASVDKLFCDSLYKLTGIRTLSKQETFIYEGQDFYDTNYHLQSEPAKRNTALWLEALRSRMIEDELWEETK